MTHRPESARQWAQAHHALAPSSVRLPDTPGALSFEQYLTGEQHSIADRVMHRKEVYLGVLLTRRTVMDRLTAAAPAWVRTAIPGMASAELDAVDDEIARVTHVLASMGASPASAADMDWLLTRSCALGLPVTQQRPVPTGEWSRQDLAAYADLARHSHAPYAPSVTVHGQGPLAGQQRHVAVLSLGTMSALEIPQGSDPWMAIPDRLGLPVEWSASFYVRPLESVSGELMHQTDKVRSQERHYREDHGLPPPVRLERQIGQVQAIDDEMSSGLTQRGTRVIGWWRLAVSAASEDETLAAARRIVDAYKPRVRIEHPPAQYAYLREFIPGENLATQGYARRGSVMWTAAAMPQVTSRVGDDRGVLVGETATRTIRPVAWDPWASQQEDGSGLSALIAGLGGGKSALGGMLVYKSLWLGSSWVVLDPSGPLGHLCSVPELAAHAQVINLNHAAPGTLNPYAIVAEPSEAEFAGAEDPQAAWQKAATHAAATRRRLVMDTLMSLLPYEVQQQPHTRTVLNRAIRAVGGGPDRHPGMVLAQLRRDQSEHREQAQTVWEFLDEASDRLTLLIPDAAEAGASTAESLRSTRLTVLTMPGLTLPREGVERKDWDGKEQESVALLNLAAWLTQRAVYDQPRNVRKGVFIDEASFLSEVSTGKMLMNRFARDSRKWTLRVLLASQVPADVLRIPGIDSLLDSVFVGRVQGEQAQQQALELLGAPTDQGYERVFGTFPDGVAVPRHFLFRDSHDRIERIRADYSGQHLAHVMAALDTTPDALAATPRTQGVAS